MRSPELNSDAGRPANLLTNRGDQLFGERDGRLVSERVGRKAARRRRSRDAVDDLAALGVWQLERLRPRACVGRAAKRTKHD